MVASSRETTTARSKRRLWALGLLSLALGIRLALAPMRGHVHDIEQFKAWTRAAVIGDPLAIYSESTANYPPLALLPLAGIGALYRLISPEFDLAAPELTALVKLPAIIADLLTTIRIYRLIRRMSGDRAALICSSLCALNPAVWYTSAWWGQLEAVYTGLMFLALARATERRTESACGWLATAVLVKPHAAIIAPVLVVAAWREGGWRALVRGGVLAGCVIATVLAPLAWAGQLPFLLAQVRASAGKQLFLTMNAHNLWYLLSLGRGSFAARGDHAVFDTQPLIGLLTGWQIGLVLLAAWCLLVVGVLWRRSRTGVTDLFLPAAALVVGFFMLPTESHERYLFPALALLTPLLPASRHARWLYLGLSLTLFLNLLWVDPAVPLPRFAHVLEWGMPIALVNTVALGLTGWTMIRSGEGRVKCITG